MTLQQLTYFLAAVEHGSFSAAAEAMYIAQPSLSEQIRRLEHSLGVPLFVRTNRKLVLTEAGQLLLPRAQNALAAAKEAEESVRGVRTLTGGTVSFGTFSSAQHLLLGDLIAGFHERHPQVRVRVVGLNSSEVADAVRDGALEAGLVSLPVDDRGLDVSNVVWTCEAVYLSTDPSRVSEPLTAERLAEAPLILPEARWGNADPTRRRLLERTQKAGFSLTPAVEVESPALAIALAARGVGDTVGSLPLARCLGYMERLLSVPLDPPLHETFAFITRREAHLSPATRVLMEMVTKHLARLGTSAQP
ncbi:LysR family transcriptional regulator [Streptomyces sporangiiformans]|uniref:LysR family transcriptional regulator n=1 Tax=Streptomyces sporangiiformans TaxID=2315329 RepID=A0A505DKW2_9ACTN|nr:LysR family transcriptional regulator [Streptomyces sporangiiformans]TPQ22328.1 LysR family transcriptional regulator [Streptomyces sporangiiformans]